MFLWISIRTTKKKTRGVKVSEAEKLTFGFLIAPEFFGLLDVKLLPHRRDFHPPSDSSFVLPLFFDLLLLPAAVEKKGMGGWRCDWGWGW